MTTETANPSQTDASTAFLRAARAGQLDKILALLNQDIDINVSNANGLNAMHLASKDGHAEVVGVLLQRGAHIDAATKKGNTALHIAALAGQEAVVRLLVQSSAQVNIQSQNGFTPLYMAAQENHDGVVKFLLANGANQSLATEDGFTPLAVAMQQGHEKVVAVLLEADTGRVRLPALHIAAKKDDCKAAALLLENDHNPDVTSKSGFTPLHIAAHYGNESVAKLLLTKGADVNCAAKHNICPLHVAAKWGKANMVALLAENSGQVDAKTRDGLTPLHCAARSGHEHVVDMLLERGAPISGKSKNGLAPLHMAAQGDHSDAARILLYHRAPVDDLTVDYLTALHVAAHCGHVKVAKLLLDRNADANARALNGFTPLHIACKKNRIKVVELLLKYGASISATTESGLTPLHVAAFMGCMNIVIYLLQHEASPDVPTVRGETPLHLAARANQTDIIRILLRNGAAVDARAREMQTALHIASRLGNVDIVLLLVQHGAQLDALTADNYNALHIAAKQHNHEVAAVLLEHGAPPNAVTKKGFTPLHLAAKYGNLKVATLLMQQRGAELDPRGKNGVTPLHVAAQYKHHAVATALLEKGADPKAAAKNGHTPLHIAARKNQMETAAALMEKDAVVDAESRAGCTPLHLAAHQGHAEMCSLLMEQGAEAGRRARSGLAALHLAAQEDHVPVAKMLVNNGAKVDVCTKGGYTPLHVASHFGQTNMVKFLLESGADVQATTCHGYTALHHAAQQGHINIVNLLLEHKADANATTNNGQTPLDIAQRLGYVTVMDTLKGVSEPSPVPTQPKDDKYRPVAPETMYETFMSDSEEEGGEDTMLTDQPYRYLTVDDMKSLGDDSLPIDVTRDERAESVIGMKNVMDVSQGSTANGPPYVVDEIATVKTVNHLYNAEVMKEGYCYNVDSTQPKRKLQWKNFLVSFLVDARGGAMRGCRGGGVRVIVPPLSAQQPTRITCRYVRAQRVSHMPPLMEGEALASRVLELGPVSAKFIGPIILEVPHYASLRGKEREIVILRSDNGTTWREHALEAADCAVQDILADTLEIEDPPEEPGASPSRMTRILTHDFPQYFAVISRIRQEVHAIGPEGGMVSSSVVPQVQAVFPQGALTKKIKVGLQAQTIEADLTAKLLGRGVAVSPVVTVEPRRRKFHKAITLSMPAPRPHSQGMINQYTTSAPTLRLLCSISGVFRKRSLEGGTNRAHWEDVTDSTPLTFVNDCVSFTTTVSARYWLMDCRNVSEATKMATELYREAIHVPFMAKFVVYAKRTEHLEAQLRVFCVTDDKEDKTLERMERFSQVAKSRDVEVHEGKPVYLEFGGNFTPVAKSGEQPKLEFRAFKESRLRLGAMVRGSHADAVARCQFMREPKRPKGEPTQPPICVLNILLPEEVVPIDLTLFAYQSKHIVTDEIAAAENNIFVHHEDLETKGQIRISDARITSICNLLGMDWVPLAYELGVSSASVGSIREKGSNGAQQAALMLKLWQEQGGLKAHDNALELALCRIGREDVLLPQSMADAERRIQRNIYQERQSSEEIVGYKSPDSELFEKDRTGSPILEQEDVNKVLDKDDIQRIEDDLLRNQQQKGNKEFAMDDSVGERDEAKYSPEEKSYVGETEEGSDIEPSLTPSEESEEEDGVKKSVAERKIQITRKLSSSKVPSSKQKRELKEEIIEIKKQINPEIKKFHVQQTSVVQQVSTESITKDSVGKLSKKSSEEDEIKKPPTPPVVEQVESPKEKVLPKAGPRHMPKHVRNESMIRFSSGDFSDIKVTQKKPDERITETKVIEETILKGAHPTAKTEIKKETITTIDGGMKTITTTEETISFEGRDIAEAPLKQKISSFESKMQSEKTSKTEKLETSKFKLTEEALKKHTEGHGTSAEYTEDFIKDQIRSQTEHEDIIYKGTKDSSKDPGSPDLVADFAAELMKAEETFMASADHTIDKYTDNYFKGAQQNLPKSFPRAMRTDSTIVQFSSEEDNEYMKKSTDSETEPESQVVTVKQKVGMLEEQISTEKLGQIEPSKSKEKLSSEALKSPKLTINIEQELIEEAEDDFLSRERKAMEYETVKLVKETDVDRLRVDSLEDSLQISSDEDAQIQPTDDESESHMKEQLSFEAADITTKMTKTQSSDLKTETISTSDTSQPASALQGMQDSPRHISQESPLPCWQSTVDRTDSLADSIQSTERDSYVSQSESKVYSKESRPGRSDSLDEASQFSDMEETQIGAAFAAAATVASQIESAAVTAKPALVRADTARFLEQESIFSSGELGDKFKKKPRTPTQEISAKARQFIETVPEDDSSVQDCFFSKRIYSDSLEESEQYGTDNDSRRPSEADSLKSDKSDPSGKDADFKMPKISSEIEEGVDENIDSSLIDDERLDSDKDFNDSDVQFEFMKAKSDSKDEDSEGSDRIFESKREPSDVGEETLFKKITKRHSRNESVSLTNFSSLELKDGDIAKMTIVPPEIPQRATEFQMFVTEATDDFPDERLSSFEREELSDKISSESSREIEMSDKKSSEGDISNRISSEDGVTGKVSSDSGAQIDDSDMKASSDTLHGAGIKSPNLVMDDDNDVKISILGKIEDKLTGMKESASDAVSAVSSKLDDSLKGIKRASLGSTGEGGSLELTARAGKRASDAPSLTDSRDYTFEESEDSIPQARPDKHDIESRAKAILEPIYDKALRAVRGDSLDDVEPFCFDQDSESPRLPGIDETQTVSDKPDEDETTVKASALASALESIASATTTFSHDMKQTHLSLGKRLSKDEVKDYSVHSSPDEVEEKICTDSESELDQAKVLEIIEPTSEGDAGYVPSFDTTKLKQDSLDDADDFFPEKEMGFDDDNLYTTTSKQTTMQQSKPGFESSTVTTTVSTVEKSSTGTKTVHETSETKIIESTLHTTESLVSKLEDLGSKFGTTDAKIDAAQEHFNSIRNQISVDEDEEDSDRQHHIPSTLSEIGATVAASIGINLMSGELIRSSSIVRKESKEIVTMLSSGHGPDAKEIKESGSKESVSKQEHHLSELASDASSTLAAAVGIEIKPEEHEDELSEKDSFVGELVADASSTLAAAIGVEFKPKEHEVALSEKDQPESKAVESVTLTKKQDSLVGELVTDASSTLAAIVGVELKSKEHEDAPYEKDHVESKTVESVTLMKKRDSFVGELVSDASSTLAATVGIEFMPEEHKDVLSEEVQPESMTPESISLIKKQDSFVGELISDASSALAATVGIHVKPEDHEDVVSKKYQPESMTEIKKDISSTLATTVGIEFKPDEYEDVVSETDHPESVATESITLVKKQDSFIGELTSDASSVLAATAGIHFKSDKQEETLPVKGQPESITLIKKRDSFVSELISDASSTLAGAVGIDFKPEDYEDILSEKDQTESKVVESKSLLKKVDSFVGELVSDASSTLAATVGIHFKPEEYEDALSGDDQSESITIIKKQSSFVRESISDASSALAASAGIELRPEEYEDALSEKDQTESKAAESKNVIEKQDSFIGELISDANTTLAASIGVTYKPKTVHIEHSDKDHPIFETTESHDQPISELIADASLTLAASVGIDYKPDDLVLHTSHTTDKLVSSDSKGALAKNESHVIKLISDTGSALATSTGEDIKPQETVDIHTETLHTVMSTSESTTHSIQKSSESTQISTTTTSKHFVTESAPIGVALKFGEEHFIKQESTELEKFELGDTITESTAKTVKETSHAEDKIEEEEIPLENILDDDRSPELSMDDVEETDKFPGMKDVDRLVRRCSDLLEGISQPDGSIIRIDTSHVTHGLSLKFSKTPPPSPVDLIHREQTGVASIADFTGQQPKGPEAFPDQTPSKLSPKDIRVLKDHLQFDTESMPTDLVTEMAKALSRSTSPKSPTRHHVDNISFVNVEALTIHPEPDVKSILPGDVAVDESQAIKEDSRISAESITKTETVVIDTPTKIKDFQESQISFKEETRKKFEDMKRDFEDNAIAKFEQMKKEFVGKDITKKTFEGFGASEDGTTLISKRESVTHQISGKEFYSEVKETLTTDDDVKAKIETKRQISGEEYELKQKESIEKSGDVTHSERSSVERDEKGSAEREDTEIQEAKKIGDEVAIVTTQKEFAEQSLYSGRQSKSEEKMTAIKEDVSKKSEISYSERDLSHEQWGKEYFTERTELEPTEEVDAEFSQGKDVEMVSAVKIVEMDEKITSEELSHEGVVISESKCYSKEESTVESKEHDDLSSDISHDTSFKSEVAGKRGSFDEKSEMSPKSRSKSLKKEEVYEVDFIKEIRISTSQREKSLSQGGSLDTQSESDLTGESDFVLQTHQDLPDDFKIEDTKFKSKIEDKVEKVLSPVHKPEENIIQEHVWEVSVQQQEPLDEVASEIHLQSKSIRDESRSWDLDFASHSESKSSISGSDIGLTTISSDRDVKIRLNGLSVTSSEDIHDAEAPSEDFESFKDSMIKSGESVETEYMIQSIDSQDAETLQKSMDSVSADTMQHSEREDYSLEAESFVPDLHQRKGDHKIVKEKSLEDICSSGYDTDLSSAEFLASKLEHERADVTEPVRPQPLAELSDLEKTIDEVKQSLEAAHGQIISEKSDSSIKYKQSPSEFEFKLISPDRPEVIQEEPPESGVKSEQIKQDSKPTVTGYIQKQAYASSSVLEEQHQVKKDYVELGEELTTKDKSIEVTMTDKDIQISVKDSDTSSSKHDDMTTITSDDEKETAHEKEKPSNTQQEFSDFSTGMESGPISLLDTETELTSDKEESPKSSPEALVKLRPIHKHVKSAHMTSGDRRSGSDVEGWSSSGESHYQSFEHTDSPQSRPLSSDVENLITGHSTADFHSALTTQDLSLRSHKTSKEYYTAVSSISSRDSMRSLDSESSGNLASVDISDASETLVPSATELKEEMMESGNFNEQFDIDHSKLKDTPTKDMEESAEDLEVQQIQMISSLDVVSHPIGSSDHSEEGSLDDEVNAINENSEIISKMKRSHEMSFQPKELLPEKFPSESLSESVDMDLESTMPESDSQVFTMSKIETGPREIKHVKESTEVTSSKSTHSRSKESPKSFEVSEKIVEYHTSTVVYKTPEKKQKPTEIEETIVERKVTTVKTESKPSKTITTTTTVTEQQNRDVDFDAMMGEIIPKGSQEYKEIVGCQVLISKSGPSVSGSSSYEKKITGPYPLDSQQSSSSSLKIQEDHLSTPQTPISNPSQSSESTDNGREYVLDDMYEISEDPELYHSERAMTDSKSEISVTAEERTLYETQKEPESPSSDEFEMVDKPSEIDDFVVIEEVAKEASEFDAEGKSLCIGKMSLVKKHDEEIEEYLSQTAKKTSETEYSTSGSLSEEEILQYELEQKRLKAAENAEIEAGKKWIQMQFEGDLAAARYDYERGPLEDIKEEEMTDFDASRFGSLTSQKESVGSYGSLKNSFGSLSESEMNLRKRYMMRYGEQDDVSVSSLQEFEHLEQALSMENYQHSSSSQDSLNGSLSRRYHLSKGPQGDDVSVSSLKEFEGLESACLEALKIEINAKQKEALLLSHDGRLSSAGFLDMERRSYSQGSSESSPPQKSSSSPGQKSGSPSQKSSSPSLKSGSPGQKYGSPSQKAISEAVALRKMIDQQMAEGVGDIKVSTSSTADGGTTVTYVTAQKKVFDNRGAFYVPDTSSTDCEEVVCSKKITYECQQSDGTLIPCQQESEKDEPQDFTELGSSFTEADANMIGVITTTRVIQKRFVDGKMVSETVTTSTGKGMDIPGAMQEEQSGEFGSGSFHSIDVGSGKSDFSTSMTSQQSDTESLITMMEQQLDSELGSLETLTFTKKVVVGTKPAELDLGSRSSDASDSGLRETSPLSNRSGSGVFSGITSKPFTDPASGSWSGLDEDMSSSGSFSRNERHELKQARLGRAKEEDLMLGSTDSLEQTSSNATRATYNYEVDTPMTGSLTSAGSNTMVSSLETLEPLTTVCDRGERTLRLSTEDCFTADHSGSDHMDEYEIQEPDSDLEKLGHSKPQVRERTIRFGSEGSSEDTSAGQSGSATFFIGDTPITRGDKSGESSTATSEATHPVPAQRKSLTGLTKPISFEAGRFKVHGSKEDEEDDEENV